MPKEQVSMRRGGVVDLYQGVHPPEKLRGAKGNGHLGSMGGFLLTKRRNVAGNRRGNYSGGVFSLHSRRVGEGGKRARGGRKTPLSQILVDR